MKLSEDGRRALKAKAYVQDVLAGLVPSDPEFNEVWDLIPDYIVKDIDWRHSILVDQFVALADQIRDIRNKHSEARFDRFEA